MVQNGHQDAGSYAFDEGIVCIYIEPRGNKSGSIFTSSYVTNALKILELWEFMI